MRIFTFGLKQTYKGEDRLHALRIFIIKHGITLVMDIRYNVGNQYPNWNCNGKNIRKLVETGMYKHIKYGHFKSLGIPPKERKIYKNNPEKMKEWYMKYLANWNVKKGLAEFENENIVLLCLENLNNPKTPYCHRIWLKEYLNKHDY